MVAIAHERAHADLNQRDRGQDDARLSRAGTAAAAPGRWALPRPKQSVKIVSAPFAAGDRVQGDLAQARVAVSAGTRLRVDRY